MHAWRHEEVLPVGRSQHCIESLIAVASFERKTRPVGEVAVHREPIAMEVVARRVEDDEVEAGRWTILHRVAVRARAPGERVVDRVEVRTLRHGGAALVDRSVLRDMVALKTRRGLDRGGMADSASARKVPLHLTNMLDVSRRLADRLDLRAHLEAGMKGGVDALPEVEVQVPRLEVLEQV